jgi:diacylglycerol O-acyltransferase / wax synthase
MGVAAAIERRIRCTIEGLVSPSNRRFGASGNARRLTWQSGGVKSVKRLTGLRSGRMLGIRIPILQRQDGKMADAREASARLSRRMSTQDASFLYSETRSGPLHIGAVCIFEGKLDHDKLIEHMEARIHLLPRYRQRLAFVPFNLAHATLEDDPDFDIRQHIKRHALAEETADETFLAAAMREYAPMLERHRPLWEMHLFNGLADRRSAVVWKIHHCLVDGVSGMELMNIALDLRPDAPAPAKPRRPFRPEPLPGALRSMASALIDLIDGRLDEARRAGEFIDLARTLGEQAATAANISGTLMAMASRPIVAAPWNARLVSAQRKLAYLKVAFADLRAIHNTLGGTANDTVLAIVGEAAARYLHQHKVAGTGNPIRIGCPVNVRRESESGKLGNRVSMMFPELAATPMDAVERLEAVTHATMRIKMAGYPQALERGLAAADAIPASLMGLGSSLATTALDALVQAGELMPALTRMIALPAPGINFIATNVPGAQVPLYLAGRRMVDMIGCVPLSANLGYNVAIVSYNQRVVFGMMAEPRVMPDVELMRDFAAEVFAELMAAARSSAARKSRAEQRASKPASDAAA